MKARNEHPVPWLLLASAWMLVASAAAGQDPTRPLRPPDRSSPRATLKTFLDSGDAVAAFVGREYGPSPSRERYRRLRELRGPAVECLDLSDVPPAARPKIGPAAAMALYEILSRVELPPWALIPGDGATGAQAATNIVRWVVPDTEITLVRASSGPNSGEFLFSADTVARADEFYERVRGLPFTRPVAAGNLYEMQRWGGGWMIPFSWVEAMPRWLRSALWGQPVWKWLGLGVVLAASAVSLRVASRLSRRVRGEHAFRQALARLVPPAFLLIVVPIASYLALVQIGLAGTAGGTIQVLGAAVMYLSVAWLCWRLSRVVAEAIIASPQIAPESIDAHLIRICARLLGLGAAVALFVIGAGRIGAPVYGIIASLGVGGLAIALAAQPSIENLIGSLSLFGDKPIRVGDFCKYGTEMGLVEQIGIRSTRIRGIDRTLTTIPNAVLSKMPIVNFTQRDRMLIKTVIGLRYETTPEQLRYVLARLREMLLGHPRIHPEPTRARFAGFGAGALEIEVFAYAMTKDWPELLAIREDVFLRIMDIIKQSGTALALPSQTLYFSRDNGLDAGKLQAAEAQVRQWREEGRLPFPDFSPDQMRQLRGSQVYPPPGSPESPQESSRGNPTPAVESAASPQMKPGTRDHR